MIDQILEQAEALQSGTMGFLLNNWGWIAVTLVVLGFAVDQVLYLLRYRPWNRWMHNLRVFRRYLERLFHVKLPWPPDIAPKPAPAAEPVSLDDPDAPQVVRRPSPAPRLRSADAPVKPFAPLPRVRAMKPAAPPQAGSSRPAQTPSPNPARAAGKDEAGAAAARRAAMRPGKPPAEAPAPQRPSPQAEPPTLRPAAKKAQERPEDTKHV